MTVPTAVDAHTAVLELLDYVIGVTIYDGEPIDPPKNTDGTVRPYAALYAGPGMSLHGRLSAVETDTRLWSFQVTCVGRDQAQCLSTVEKVTVAVEGARLVDTASPIRSLADPGPVTVDFDVEPHRSYVPLLFGCRLA